MALIRPTNIGLVRTWELADTDISSATASDTACEGLHSFNGVIFVITSGTVLMTVQVQESPDNVNWVVTDEQEITGNACYRIAHPFFYLRVVVSSYTSGTITSIPIAGQVQ